MKPTLMRAQTSGAITLLMATGLVFLAALATLYSSRSVLMDKLAGHNHLEAQRSQMAAQSALAWAQSDIAMRSPQWSQVFASPANCPADSRTPHWQCVGLQTPSHPEMPDHLNTVTLVRDLIMSPHVVQIRARTSSISSKSQASVRESLFIPVISPAPDNAPNAGLVINGCLSEATGANIQVCPLTSSKGKICVDNAVASAIQSHYVVDTNRNGSISTSEKTACMALSSQSLPGGGSRSGPNSASSRTPCNKAAWRSVLGDISAQQLQAWSAAQEANGLSAWSTPQRTVYWIDSPADWTWSVGSAEVPAVLIFSSQACAVRCPRISANAHIHGSVILDAGCDDEKMRGWKGGWIEGQLVVEGGIPEWQSGIVWARHYGRDAYILNWPDGIDTSRVQRINGSWSE